MKQIIRYCGLILITVISYGLGLGACHALSIGAKFNGQDTLYYKVYYNAVPVGTIEWKYLGQQIIDSKPVEVLAVKSDTNILQMFNMKGDELIFLDSQTFLPVKVQRDLMVFGKKELIQEIYDQNDGLVRISKSSKDKKDTLLKPGKPIQNIMSLLYFFPNEIDLQKQSVYWFNLPTRPVQIKTYSSRILDHQGQKKECYFIMGNANQKFKVWLDKQTRLPLRLEFISLAGKVSIVRQSTPETKLTKID